jgi:hypothetical protein
MIRTLCLGAAAVLFATGPALAESRAVQVGNCMIRHTTEDDVVQMKQLMLLALQEKKNEATAVMGGLMLQAGLTATGECGVRYAEIGSPMFEYAVRMYGEHLGTVVMERSLDFMDLPMR